jgi:hypothetical protein
MAGVTSTGFERKTLTEILAELRVELRATIDPNLVLSTESPEGQLVGIVANALAEQRRDDIGAGQAHRRRPEGPLRARPSRPGARGRPGTGLMSKAKGNGNGARPDRPGDAMLELAAEISATTASGPTGRSRQSGPSSSTTGTRRRRPPLGRRSRPPWFVRARRATAVSTPGRVLVQAVARAEGFGAQRTTSFTGGSAPPNLSPSVLLIFL